MFLQQQYRALTHILMWVLWGFISLPLQANETMSVMAVSRGSVLVGITDASVKAAVFIQNYSQTPLNNIDYTLLVNGNETQTLHYSFATPLKEKEDAVIEVPIAPASTLTTDEVTLHVKYANGQPNTYVFPYTTITRTTLSKVEKRKVVMEDYTGMWCRFCPRATAAIEHLAKKYPTDFIAIAVHDRDQLSCADYNALKLANEGRPSIVVNRSFTDKTIISTASELENKFIAEQNFQSEQARGAEASLQLEAHWNNEKTNIEITTHTTFRLEQSTAPYALAYVIIANKISKQGWYQVNSYVHDREYAGIIPEMDAFINASSYVYGLQYNHTAIQAAGIDNGLEGSIIAPLIADQEQTHHYTFTSVDNNVWLKDREDVQVCALLINTVTKKIVNAERVMVQNNINTTINTLQTTLPKPSIKALYTLDGSLVTRPSKAIHIIKYSDGTVKKQRIITP